MAEIAWRRILCPVDYSEESRAALRVALDLCRRLGAQVTLLHVRDRAAPRIGPQGGEAGSLAAFRREAEEAGVGPVGAEEVDGDPRQDIAALAVARGFDLVVMGTHGRTGRDRTLAGSVAESTVRRARCPVLVVHPGSLAAG
jgi:nucleotide-binding universal stress UspA family protein